MATVFGIELDEEITTREGLRTWRKPPSRFVANKVIDHVDPLARRFIAAASMVVLATRRTDGGIDMTPRGDPAGFVHILTDQVILFFRSKPSKMDISPQGKVIFKKGSSSILSNNSGK